MNEMIRNSSLAQRTKEDDATNRTKRVAADMITELLDTSDGRKTRHENAASRRRTPASAQTDESAKKLLTKKRF